METFINKRVVNMTCGPGIGWGGLGQIKQTRVPYNENQRNERNERK